jgi:SAM-dependent methyltransferase
MALSFSRYDTRRYITVPVRQGYAGWAPSYDAQMDGQLDLALLERMTHVDWAAIRSAVDLGCGTGRTGAWLAERGAVSIQGVDLTPEMLVRARRRGVYQTLLEEDACATSLPTGVADLVVSCLVVSHVPELGPAYDEADRLLRPGGSFVLVGYHPFLLLEGVPTHFHARGGEPVAIRNHIHLMSDHVQSGIARGWNLAEMLERIVDDDWIDRAPRWARHRYKPVSFAMVWQKTTMP